MTAKKPTTAKAAPAGPTTLQEALAAKAVRLVRKRRNGTLRSLPYLASGCPERKDAEQVATRRQEGETVGTIAVDLNLSVATVRRMTEALALAQQVEDGDHDGKYKPGDKQVVISVVGAVDTQTG
ncbi:hypothetical protein [Aeromicrobium alkaliterrae]|uniref:Helix-turn-helix domain-containing protein n=1 Tax=Aeromicrobium alkaliterrae TaxID=302168 RepID=A0ABN2JSL8_9ACTN